MSIRNKITLFLTDYADWIVLGLFGAACIAVGFTLGAVLL